VGAWVRLREGAEIDAEGLRAAAAGRIAHHKIPEHVWIVDAFPMTVTGKIQKYRIREIVERERRERGADDGDSVRQAPAAAGRESAP
jgi:fatty-acyl-CoA synthase